MPNLIRVNMTTGNVRLLPLPAGDIMPSGRVFNSRVLYTEMDPEAPPLGTGGIITVSPGSFAGRELPFADEILITAKSPLDGDLHTVRVISRAARMLSAIEASCIAIEGRSRSISPLFLLIDRSKSSLARIPGLTSWKSVESGYRLQEEIHRVFGHNSVAIFCGPLAAAPDLRTSFLVSGSSAVSLKNIDAEGLDGVFLSKGLAGVIIKAPLQGLRAAHACAAPEGLSDIVSCARHSGLEGTPFARASLCGFCLSRNVAATETTSRRACADLGISCAYEDIIPAAPCSPQALREALAGIPILPEEMPRMIPADYAAALDGLGICCRAVRPEDCEEILSRSADLLNRLAGSSLWTAERLLEAGRETLSREQAFSSWAHRSAPRPASEHPANKAASL